MSKYRNFVTMDYQRKKKGHGVNDLSQQSWSGSDADFALFRVIYALLYFAELLAPNYYYANYEHGLIRKYSQRSPSKLKL